MLLLFQIIFLFTFLNPLFILLHSAPCARQTFTVSVGGPRSLPTAPRSSLSGSSSFVFGVSGLPPAWLWAPGLSSSTEATAPFLRPFPVPALPLGSRICSQRIFCKSQDVYWLLAVTSWGCFIFMCCSALTLPVSSLSGHLAKLSSLVHLTCR